MTPIIRSVLSVLGAFFVVVVLVALATALSAELMLGSIGPGTEPTTPFLAVNLAYSVLFAIVGGYVAATVSDHAPLGHAAALSGVMILLGLITWSMDGGQPAPGQPAWYPLVMAVMVPPTAVLGGILVTRRTRSQTRFSRRARELDETSSPQKVVPPQA
jgi:peptidoglycan/LPS O-acetylase OafA/YrhL